MNKAKSSQINLRVPADVVEDLDALAKHTHVTRIDVARQILMEGIQQRKREHALRLFQQGKVSKSRAAEIAGISLWEFMESLDQAAIAAPYEAQDAIDDVRRLVASVVPSSPKSA